ncbi:MAG: PHP domain-containing protein [Bacteroides sp.]
MKAIDLHVHSTYSDGTFTPAELIKNAQEIGLSAMALTDHDTTHGIDEAVTASEGTGIELIPGIELSCNYGGFKEIHIVGLYIDKDNSGFKTSICSARDSRDERNIEMAERFKSIGIPVTIEELQNEYKGAVITRAHFADFLVKKGFVKSRKEAFDRYLNDNGPCYVPRKRITAEDGINLIKNAGGVPILAHPTLYHLGNDVMHRMLGELKQSGLVGMECIYSTYTMGEELEMRRLAKEFDLIMSGGSDFHGANKPNISLGTGKGSLFVPESLLDAIRLHRAY